MQRSFFATSAIVGLAFALSCASLSAQTRKSVSTTSSDAKPRPYASILSTAVWADKNIPVCWDNPTSNNEEGRKITQQAVLDTWEAVSGITFIGWKACPQLARGIRITIIDSDIDSLSPRTMGLGTQLERRGTAKQFAAGNMLLNFTFEKWNTKCDDVKLKKSTCIRSIAIHEFGHAIGFAHEQNRSDNLGQCNIVTGDQQGDENIGKFDTTSVMNYCYSIYREDLKLSKLDIEGVQAKYGDQSSKKP